MVSSHCLEVRDEQGAERILLTAINHGASVEQLSDMMLTAITDHVYMNTGHTLDFHNKAFETLEQIGDEHRPYVLTSLLPGLGNATRSEELHSWQSPVNLVTPLEQAFTSLPQLLSHQNEPVQNESSVDESALLDQLLSDHPIETISYLTDALEKSVSPIRLAQLVALAAAERIARFHTQNEFRDWITVLHTFTHAHAVHESLRRSVTPELIRGVFHAAMTVYQDRFLNIPSAKRPNVSKGSPPSDPQQLLELLDSQQKVEEAATWVMQYLENNGDMNTLFATLGHALLREDAEFHSFQMLEAAFIEYEHWQKEDSELSKHAQETLILAVTRYLAGHAPTSRELPHTVQIAIRLHRGDHLFDEE
ncbi:hypothetical protein AB4Y30_03970 [Ornithinibacillus sp. 4-3]|uniref:Uncharacterized protein n=1 Tax=Ornithinibacillus sp. 4-3 TaxID=3231488 RepID=A0AB39HSI3_9BACI